MRRRFSTPINDDGEKKNIDYLEIFDYRPSHQYYINMQPPYWVSMKEIESVKGVMFHCSFIFRMHTRLKLQLKVH